MQNLQCTQKSTGTTIYYKLDHLGLSCQSREGVTGTINSHIKSMGEYAKEKFTVYGRKLGLNWSKLKSVTVHKVYINIMNTFGN